MNTQQSSWLVSFGVMPPPVPTQEKPEIETIVRSKSFVRNESTEKAKIIKKMKFDIVEAMERGIAGRGNIYAALLADGKIPETNGIPMTIKAFGQHLVWVRRNVHRFKKVEINLDNSPKGQKAKAICDLFDSGVSEEDITKIHGINRSYAYNTLIQYGRIEKRNHSFRKRSNTVKFPGIHAMIKENKGAHEISQVTGSTIKYIKKIMLERKRALKLIGHGKSADDVCNILNICKFHAESYATEALK